MTFCAPLIFLPQIAGLRHAAPQCNKKADFSQRRLRLQSARKEPVGNSSAGHSSEEKAPRQDRDLPRHERLKPNLAGPYNTLIAEAEALGIPGHALPELPEDPTLNDVREAQRQLEGMIASFTSANI